MVAPNAIGVGSAQASRSISSGSRAVTRSGTGRVPRPDRADGATVGGGDAAGPAVPRAPDVAAARVARIDRRSPGHGRTGPGAPGRSASRARR